MPSRITAEGSTLDNLSSIPTIKTFQIDSGGIGNITDSVNLFRGDINLPINLVSLPGRGGLEANVTLMYQSNIQNNVDTWNLESPTGLVGFGWSMPYDMIAINNKGNASISDDAYYLVSGGASNRLYKTGESDGSWEFELENYKFWDIRYNTQTEEWTVTKEDGSQHIYGGQATDLEQSPLQYGVRWVHPNRNWIGSSTDSDGQQPFVLAWNLTKIQNPWGDGIIFGYESSLDCIGSTDGLQYTRDTRLKTITDPFGRSVVFNYSDKTYTDKIHEYQLPHVDPSSSKFLAYQDRYGTQFLQSITVANPAVSGQASSGLLFTVEFDYDLVNASLDNSNDPNFYKRYLTGIAMKNSDGKSLPGISFSYYNRNEDLDDQTHRGALRTITYPKGGLGTYTYDKVVLSNTDRSINISVTGKPRVWFGGDYAVVTQYDDSDLTVQIYSWNGNWTEDPSSTTLSHKLDIDSLQVSAQSDFFALSFKTAETEPQMMMYLFHKAKGEFGKWQSDYDTLTVDADGEQALLVSGNSFVVACASGGEKRCKVWDVPSGSWMDRSSEFSIDAGGKYALAAFNNYFALSTYDSSDDNCSLDIYYLDETSGKFVAAEISGDTVSSVEWQDNSTAKTFWSLGVDYAVATYITNSGQENIDYGVRIYQWDASFNAHVAVDESYTVSAGTDLPFSYSIARGSIVGNAENLFRFDGVEWETGTLNVPSGGDTAPQFAYGSGMAVVADGSSNSVVCYSPYSNGWETPTSPTTTGEARPTVSNNFLTIGNSLYYRASEGDLTDVGTLGSDIDADAIFNAAPLFIAYQDSDGNAHIVPLRNGGIDSLTGTTTLDGEKIYVDDQGQPGTTLVGSQALVTYRGDDFDSASNLTLYWVINGAVKGSLYDFPVAKLAINDGYQTKSTLYKYDTRNTIIGPNAIVTEYAAATVIPGMTDDNPDAAYPAPTQTPFGKTESSYYIGQTLEVHDNYDFLHGLLSTKTDYDADGNKVADEVNTYAVFTNREDIDDPSTRPDLYGAYVRAIQKKSTLYGNPISTDGGDGDAVTIEAVTQTMEYTYSSQTGLLTEQTTDNYNSEGIKDTLKQSQKYGWEEYDALKDSHIWSPVVQSINFTNDEPTAIAVTTWKQWFDEPDLTQWAPCRSYQARTKGVYDSESGTLQFDDWNNDNPPSSEEWLKVSENVSYAEVGVVLETLDVDDVPSTVLLDANSELAVAGFLNASQAAVTYVGFESYEQTQEWQMSGGSQSLEACIISGDAHTGTQSLQLLPDAEAVLENSLTISDTGQIYILSCWMKTPNHFSGDSGAADWVINVDGDDVDTFSIDGTDGNWQYRNYVVDLKPYASDTSVTVTMKAYNHKTSADLYILLDDIFFAPLVGDASATVYDPTFKIPTASINFAGKTGRDIYDTFQRPVAQIGPCENVTAVSSPYLTRQDNDADPFVFPQDDPNSTLTINATAGGRRANFVNGDEWIDDWSSDNMDNWTVDNSALVHTQAAMDSITFVPTQDFVDFGARVSVVLPLDDQGEPMKPQNPIGMSIGTLSAQWTPGAGWTVTSPDGTVTVPDDADTAFNTEWLLVAGGDTLFFYADGRQIFVQHTTQTRSGALELFVQDTDISFTNIVVFKEPQHGITYTDGANQERQTQTLNGTDCLITATCYDDLGRAKIATKTETIHCRLARKAR